MRYMLALSRSEERHPLNRAYYDLFLEALFKDAAGGESRRGLYRTGQHVGQPAKLGIKMSF